MVIHMSLVNINGSQRQAKGHEWGKGEVKKRGIQDEQRVTIIRMYYI